MNERTDTATPQCLCDLHIMKYALNSGEHEGTDVHHAFLLLTSSQKRKP